MGNAEGYRSDSSRLGSVAIAVAVANSFGPGAVGAGAPAARVSTSLPFCCAAAGARS